MILRSVDNVCCFYSYVFFFCSFLLFSLIVELNSIENMYVISFSVWFFVLFSSSFLLFFVCFHFTLCLKIIAIIICVCFFSSFFFLLNNKICILHVRQMTITLNSNKKLKIIIVKKLLRAAKTHTHTGLCCGGHSPLHHVADAIEREPRYKHLGYAASVFGRVVDGCCFFFLNKKNDFCYSKSESLELVESLFYVFLLLSFLSSFHFFFSLLLLLY